MAATCVMVVEDESLVAEGIRKQLLKLGYHVPAVFAAGEEALARIGEFQPNLVLMDIRLAGPWDGVATAKRLHSQYDIPVVFLTAYSDEKTLEEVSATELYGYLVKPFRDRDLDAAIQIALRRHAQHRQRKTDEQKYRQLVEDLHEGVWVIDPAGLTLFVNARMAEMMGYATNEIAGKAFFHFMDKPSIALAKRNLKRHRQGIREQFDFYFLRKDGTRLDTSVATSPILDAAGNHIGTIAAVADVSLRKKAEEEIKRLNEDLEKRVARRTAELRAANRKLRKEVVVRTRAEQALRKSKELFAAFMDNLPGLAFIKDDHGRHLFINKRFEKILGIGKKNWHGKTNSDIYPQEMALRFTETDRKALASDAGFEFEETTDYAGLPKQWLTIKFPIPDGHSKASRLGCIAIETTERKRMERALIEQQELHRQLAENVNEIFWVFDLLQQQMLFVNHAFEAIMSMSCGEVLADHRSWHKLVHIADRDMLPGLYQANGNANIEFRVMRPDGELRWIRARTFPIMNAQGEVYRLAGLAADITKYKQASERERRQNEMLIQADKLASLGSLVAGIAHEINNPANFVLLNAPLLRDFFQDALPILETHFQQHGDFPLGRLPYSRVRKQISDLFSGIIEGGERIMRIVKELREFARPDSSSFEEPIDLAQVIRSATTILANKIKKSTEHFAVESCTTDIPLVRGSYQKLEQVLINLIQNACESLGDRNQGILLSTTYNPVTHCVEIKVQDEGCGIPKEHRPHIMDPFFSTKHHLGGTGLGLSIASQIIHRHGGRIEFDSIVGQGTTVTVTLPAAHPCQSGSSSL